MKDSAKASRDSIFIGITGGSGAPYTVRLIEEMLSRKIGVSLSMSESAVKVLRHELGRNVDLKNFRPKDLLGHDATGIRFFHPDDLEAPASSGTSAPRAAVIVPCSGGTLGAIAGGLSDNLIRRVGEAMLKEGKLLILVPRETPVSIIHLENLLRVARAGAVILPASPAFYTRPKSLDDAVNFVVGKILDRLGIEHTLFPRWTGESARS